ncbi:TetR/AcrR family transcriptional regulator [Gracilibacillus massiliensis]|uniref:TetR/AcrR family transcriptional regulator n=1 Tax=Gracilibacillus massiliensis TaxID=1564956 RepID=UPI00071E1A7F|nr:TetR/AcrR family transcriptional regulator [Gracilibacillus massiliensis]
MDKKAEIKAIAIQLFSKKGFSETSVQEIAQQSGISKGGFYTYFSTKTDLILEMINDYHDKVIDSTKHIEALKDNDDLARYIQFELEAWIDHQAFFHVLFNEFAPKKHKQITEKMEELRVSLEHNHREIFHQAYGDKVKPYVTDLLVMFEGLMKEYLLYMSLHPKDYSTFNLSQWITSIINAIVQRLNELEPFLKDGENESIFQVIETIKENINQKQITNGDRLLEALYHIEQEIQNRITNSVTMEAMFLYLKREPSLYPFVIKLERLSKQEDKET